MLDVIRTSVTFSSLYFLINPSLLTGSDVLTVDLTEVCQPWEGSLKL